MIAVRTRKYRGARILIINEFQAFLTIIYYRGKFYHSKHDAVKRGDYTNKEFMEACDIVYKEAKQIIDVVKTERSLLFKIIQVINKIYAKCKRSLPKHLPQERGEAEEEVPETS